MVFSKYATYESYGEIMPTPRQILLELWLTDDDGDGKLNDTDLDKALRELALWVRSIPRIAYQNECCQKAREETFDEVAKSMEEEACK